jgi:hypothetical protein
VTFSVGALGYRIKSKLTDSALNGENGKLCDNECASVPGNRPGREGKTEEKRGLLESPPTSPPTSPPVVRKLSTPNNTSISPTSLENPASLRRSNRRNS